MTGHESDASPLLLGLDLRDRLVTLVGGGPVALRRARALLEAGARLRLVSPRLCPELAALAHEAGERVTWRARRYAGPGDLDGAWLVHTATGDPGTDARVATDADAARVFCVRAGAAGGGTARVPARASVPTRDGRVDVAVLAGGDPRRAQAVRTGIAEALAAGRLDLRRRRPRPDGGWVALVGGGPGAEGLLTVRARELLAAADVVVVDRLAPRGVLAELPPEVRVLDVGKEVGLHQVPQQEINRILVAEATAGRGVVRLKGGDPYVLGRGGEERAACEAAGVPVEVVPGVTSAVAVPAAAGIPVTHRGLARSFTVVTGHDQIPDLPTSEGHTLVVLMGVARLRDTVAALLAAGRSAACPAAVVERGFLPGQRTTVAPLRDLAERAAQVGVHSPAVVVIGAVVRLSPEWRAREAEARPLAPALRAPLP